MAGEDLTVLIKGQATSLIKSFRDISTEAELSAGKTEKSFANVGKAIALAGAAIAGVAGVIAAASVKSALSFEAAQARMQTAIKDTGGSFKDFAPQVSLVEAQMTKLGFSNSTVVNAMAPLIVATHSTEKALSLQSLAANIARGRNIDLASAENILVKVVTGHVALLARLGIATKDVTGKTISQNQAIKELAQFYNGNAAAFTTTPAGKLQALGAEFDNLKDKIGEALIPILEHLVDFVNGKLVPAFQNVWTFIDKNKTLFQDFTILLAGAGLAALTAYGIELGVVAVEAVIAYAPLFVLAGAIAGVAIAANAMGISWQNVWNNMGNVVADVGTAILATLNNLITAINLAFKVINTGTGAVNAVTSKIPFIGSHVQIPTLTPLNSVAGSVTFTPISTGSGQASTGAGQGGGWGTYQQWQNQGGTPTITLPSINGENFNTLPGGAAGSSGSGSAGSPKKAVTDLSLALGLLTPNVKFFEQQLENTIKGVSASSAAAQAAAYAFVTAKDTLIGAQLDLNDSRRNLALAKNDAPLARFAVTDAQTQLTNDIQGGADAETITKDQIALRDAQINVSKSTDDIKRATLDLHDKQVTEIQDLKNVTSAHKLLNEVLHGFPKNSVEVFKAMGALAQALGGTLGVKGAAQHGPGHTIVINVAGHVLTEQQLQTLIVKALQQETTKNGSVKKVRVSK